jgi:hypothetical protein
MEAYDLVIVGGDEVWNLSHPWRQDYPLFFGEGLRTRRLASYAASFGNYDPAPGLDAEWAERLRKFSAISVCDERARSLVQGAMGYEPPVVLDPCLQFPEQARRERRAPGLYVAVYGHSFPDWFAQSVRSWARRRGLPLISIGYVNPWADAQGLDAGPEEFASLMAGARAVATNFFHGCVFALVNALPFVCVGSNYGSHTLRALASSINAEERLVTPATTADGIARLLDTPIDGEVLGRLDELRARSERYLDNVLD